MSDDLLVVANEIQRKFQFYLVALALGALALSVQTANFHGPPPADIAELLGWLLLLSSGVVGLWRLEGLPAIYHAMGLQNRAEEAVYRLQVNQERGVPGVTVLDEDREEPIGTSIAKWQKTAEEAAKIVAKLNRPANRKYQVQRYAFLGGIVCLMVSRGYEPMLGLTCSR